MYYFYLKQRDYMMQNPPEPAILHCVFGGFLFALISHEPNPAAGSHTAENSSIKTNRLYQF